MAKDYYVDYSNNNPKLMDGKTGKQIGADEKRPQPTLPGLNKAATAKLQKDKRPTHILRHIDKVNHETAGGPKPKSNAWYYESWGSRNGIEDKPDTWDLMKKTAKSPEDIKAIRTTVNDAYKRNPELVSKDEMKFVDILPLKDKTYPTKPKSEPPTMIIPADLSMLERTEQPSKTFEDFLQSVKTKPDPDLDKGIAGILGVKK
tara:strand:- start:820 stop:1428 length:609 start_codon:yes stop_codon:yes gene_type:complete